jgi:DNA recombination protein RmuC
MGFKTLAIEKRSSEVWQTLGAVKSEFAKFGDLLQKAQNKFQSGLNDIDSLIGTRTKAIQRKLRGVEALGEPSQADLLTSIEKAPFVTEEDDEEND